jgi:nucleotide-binding universal stress UspA family protein
MMYHTLLVPLDGSAYSERALPMAMSLARHLKARVFLVRTAGALAFPGADAADAQVHAVREARTYLEVLAAGMSGQGADIEIAVPFGDAAGEILEEIGLRKADLVVMCTHGRSGLGRWIYGSVAEQVLHRSPVPVLLVQPTGDAMTLAPEPGRTSFLVPLDGSAFAEAALPHAAAMARSFGGRILLLRTFEPPIAAYSYAVVSPVQVSSEELQREVEAYLEEVAARLRADGLSVETTAREGWPARVIAQQSAALGPGLIVMATHGRTGVARLFLGSVALEIVRRSALPVMLIRPTQHTVAAS